MPTRLQQADQAIALLYHARLATPFFSRDGQPCASIPREVDSRRIFPLRSADFRDWLTANYYSEFESAPSPEALRTALRTLEARAQYGDTPAQKIDRRLSFEGDPFAPSKILLDLANPAGEILEITSHGWSITDNLSHSFRQSSSTLPLPVPVAANPKPPPIPLTSSPSSFISRQPRAPASLLGSLPPSAPSGLTPSWCSEVPRPAANRPSPVLSAS